ncbi:ergot alkaloid biosynthesis protein [Saccharopolyspora taberi]|uniref:NAD(P)H-binding protein n=1 Tax=Saccharopolyspora taberi TaxID=60895 RepID=A0ABN3VMT2_9PSEU
MTVLITGGTGNTGRPLADLLRARGVGVRVASRHPAGADHVFFDWADPASHRTALAGVESVYLVQPIGAVDPMPLVRPFLDAVGDRPVVLLGSLAVVPDAPGIDELNRAVRAIPGAAVLRPSGFMQNFTGAHPVADAIRERGEFSTATGNGRIGWVDAEDIAAVAAELLAGRAERSEYVLTGPEALSCDEAAAVITEVTGRPVRHVGVSVAQRARMFAEFGVPEPFARGLAAIDADIRGGSEDRVTTDVADVTGRAPRSLRDFVAAQLGPVTSMR